MWMHQRRLQRSRRLVAPDFPGHGDALSPDEQSEFSEAAFARFALDALDAAGIERAFLVGHSMGGAIALKIAIEHPQRVAGLLLTNTGGGSDDPAAARAAALRTAGALLSEGFEPFVQAMLAGPLFSRYASRTPRSRRHMELLLRQHSPQGLALTQRGIHAVRPPIQERELEAVRAPAMIVVGSLDAGCLNASRLMARRIRGARYLEIAGVGHMAPLEVPRRFNMILEDVLA